MKPLVWKMAHRFPWAAREWFLYENKVGDRLKLKKKNNYWPKLSKYRDLSAASRLVSCLSQRMRQIFCLTSSNNFELMISLLCLKINASSHSVFFPTLAFKCKQTSACCFTLFKFTFPWRLKQSSRNRIFSQGYGALCFWFVLDTQLNNCLLFTSQVEDVNAKFAALEKLKNNNWIEEEKKTRKFTKKSKAKVCTSWHIVPLQRSSTFLGQLRSFSPVSSTLPPSVPFLLFVSTFYGYLSVKVYWIHQMVKCIHLCYQ